MFRDFCLGSKKVNQTVAGAPGKAGHIQVIHNGKIVTPQSLLPRKTVNSSYTAKRMTSKLVATEQDEPDNGSAPPHHELNENEKEPSARHHQKKTHNLAASSRK
jgi:hypothetical protein